MEIFFIIVLAIAVVWQFLAIIAYSSESDRKILEQERNYNELKSRLNQFRDSFNAGARRGNEHLPWYASAKWEAHKEAIKARVARRVHRATTRRLEREEAKKLGVKVVYSIK
jgi:hypothetical protein